MVANNNHYPARVQGGWKSPAKFLYLREIFDFSTFYSIIKRQARLLLQLMSFLQPIAESIHLTGSIFTFFKFSTFFRGNLRNYKKSKFGSHCGKSHIEYEGEWLGVWAISKVTILLKSDFWNFNENLAKRAPNISKPILCPRVKRRDGVCSRLRKSGHHPTWPLRRTIHRQWYEHQVGASLSILLHLQFRIINNYDVILMSSDV